MAKKPYTVPCYHSHKPITVGPGTLYGGNCATPFYKDADYYVGLEILGANMNPKAFPWNEGEAFTFHIPNGGVPADVINFVKLVDWIGQKLEAGKSIHVGCIGGHGRTGLVLAAVCVMMGVGENLDPIGFLRSAYCPKAVETAAQVEFLALVFGCKSAVPYYVIKAQGKGYVA